MSGNLESARPSTDEISSSNQTHLKAAYTLFPQLQPYVKLGGADYEEQLRTVTIAGLAGTKNIDFDYDWGFAVGGGLQGIQEFGSGSEWLVGYDLQYLRSDHDLSSVTHEGRAATGVSGAVSGQEWQSAFYAGRRWTVGEGTLTPYVGGRWSTYEIQIDSNLNYTDATDGAIAVIGSTQTATEFGALVGATYRLPNRWRIGIEGRFVDETALTLQGSYTF